MPKVLVVEADAIVRNLMIRVLSRQGLTVYEAASAEEALVLCKALNDEHLDLVIADHQTSSRDITERILGACTNTKILQISGWPFEVVQREEGLLPGSSFLQKPFTATKLLETVETLLSPRTQ